MDTMEVGADESVTAGAVVEVEVSACEAAVVEDVAMAVVVREVWSATTLALVVACLGIEVSNTVVVEARGSSISVVSVSSPFEPPKTAKPTTPTRTTAATPPQTRRSLIHFAAAHSGKQNPRPTGR